jgi:Rod binding domain-containing protein
MNVMPIQSADSDANVPIEDLAGNKHLTRQQKIHEASRQFEAIMLKQILSEMQKPVITSEFTDDSTAAGVYQDYISNALAQSISKSGGVGFANVFEQQLSPQSPGRHGTASAAHSEIEPMTSGGTGFQPAQSDWKDAPLSTGRMPAPLPSQKSPSAKVHE